MLTFDSKSFGTTIDRTIGRRMQRLIVRSVARCYDWSCYRSLHPTIDRTIGIRVPRLIIHSVTGCHECSYDRSQDATIARTIGRRMQRSIDRTIGRRPSRLIIHRSLIATTSRTIYYDVSCHRYSPIVHDSMTTRINRSRYALLEIVANIADRSQLGPIASNRTTQKSYDPVWLWLYFDVGASCLTLLRKLLCYQPLWWDISRSIKRYSRVEAMNDLLHNMAV